MSINQASIERVFLPILYKRINEQLGALRESFVIDLELRGKSVPDTWDGMEALFQTWLIEQERRESTTVTPESKQNYNELAQMEDETKYVPCERCGGDGYDPDGYLSMTGERMYCPRCGGNGVHLA